MRLHDGELSPSERADAEARLAHDPALRAALDTVRRLSTLIHEAESSRAERAPDVSDAVMAALLGAAPTQAPRSSTRAPARAWPRRLGAPAALAGLALAAGVAMLLTRPTEESLAPTARLVAPPTAAPVYSGEPRMEALDHGVSIETIDFGSTQGAIFLVSEGASETMVVWTMDEPDAKGRGVEL